MKLLLNRGWLYVAIAKYLIVDKYSEYDLVLECPNEKNISIEKIKKLLEKIKYNINVKDEFIDKVKIIFKYFEYEIKDSYINDLYEIIQDEKKHVAFKLEEYKNVSLTFHSSKGLEFDQVVIFSNDYNLRKENDFFNHYVAVTRAKEKLIIIAINNQYKTRLENILNENNIQFEDVFDCRE